MSTRQSSCHRRALLVLGLVVLLVLAGCSGVGSSGQNAGGGGGAGGPASTPTASGGGSGADNGDGGDGDDGATSGSLDGNQALDGRAVVRNGEVDLRVESYDEARGNLTDVVTSAGGYVSDSTERVREVGNESYTTGTLVLRVPSENFSTTFERVKAEGTVVSASTSSEDVTRQVVDLQARLENLRAERDRLRELYQRANETEDVLAVQEKLSDVQQEIERLEAQLRTLRGRVAFATVTVNLSEPRPDAVYEDRPTQRWYDTPVFDAFRESVRGVGVVFRALAVGGAYVAPYVLAFGVPALAAALLVSRRTAVAALYRHR